MEDSLSLHRDSLLVDSLIADTLAVDSANMSLQGEEMKGIVLINPLSAYQKDSQQEEVRDQDAGMSWIYLGLVVLFCTIAMRFKGSVKYLHALVTDLTDTRVRHNLFDDTVKETSLIILLNLMWVASTGIMLWIGIRNHFGSPLPGESIGLNMLPAKGIGICMGLTAVYLVVMILAYWIVGNVFSDVRQTTMWVKGATSSTGLQAFLMFPIALVALNYPACSGALFIVAAIVFVIGKIMFLYQGFRIFFSQISSWLLFLYYLCSLEIIPVIMICAAAVGVCTSGQ